MKDDLEDADGLPTAGALPEGRAQAAIHREEEAQSSRHDEDAHV